MGKYFFNKFLRCYPLTDILKSFILVLTVQLGS